MGWLRNEEVEEMEGWVVCGGEGEVGLWMDGDGMGY
jgi:hypothetical protein